MTPRQASVLEAIRAHQEAHGHTPTYQEIAVSLGLKSKGSIARVIESLERDGRLSHMHGVARSLELAEPSHPMTCPHCGGALAINVQQRSEAA